MGLTVATYRVRTLDQAGFREWHKAIARIAGGNPVIDTRAHIQATGETVLCWRDGAPGQFTWCCPGCGGTWLGTLGDEPVSGWDAPRWVNSGTLECPTLTPSLGCPLWHSGRCEGHWWLRDGRLELA